MVVPQGGTCSGQRQGRRNVQGEVLHDAEDLRRVGQGTSLHNFGELRVTVDVLGGSEGDGCVVGEGTSDSRNVL